MNRLFEWGRKEWGKYHPVEFIAEREFESQKEILQLFQIPFPKEGQERGRGGCGGRPDLFYLIGGAHLKRAENVPIQTQEFDIGCIF